MMLEQLDIHIKREPVITYYIQKLTQIDHKPKYKMQNYNIGENLIDLEIGNEFLNIKPKA